MLIEASKNCQEIYKNLTVNPSNSARGKRIVCLRFQPITIPQGWSGAVRKIFHFIIAPKALAKQGDNALGRVRLFGKTRCITIVCVVLGLFRLIY